MAKSYKGKLPRPDARGYYRPEVGGVRFTVGRSCDVSGGEAKRRLDMLRLFFDRQCEERSIKFWAGCNLPWAHKVARGEPLLLEISDKARRNPGEASEQAIILRTLQEYGLPVQVDDGKTITVGTQQLQNWIDESVRTAVLQAYNKADKHWAGVLPESLHAELQGAAPEEPENCEYRSFHEALAAYRDYKQENGKKQDNGLPSPSVKKFISWTKTLQKHHEDFAVWQLDGDRLENLVAYWRNRPATPRAKGRISKDYAKHMIDCLWSVCTWLDRSSNWKWEFPRNADKIVRAPHPLDSDRRAFRTRQVSESTYTPDQLATIARSLSKSEKMILGLSVNCAFQPAESGRAEIDDYHPHHPDTGEYGPWFIFHRPKTQVYGQWLLWKEVAALVEWGIDRSRQLNAERLIITDAGEPWYREQNANESVKFGKWWQAIPTEKDPHCGVVTRIQKKQPDFPRNTIKTLRKILPNLIRPKFGREVADVINARAINRDGRMAGGEIERYADPLFDKAAEAIRSLEEPFRPFLDALAEE